MDWPLTFEIPRGTVIIPGPGRYVLSPHLPDILIDDLLDAARAQLGVAGVAWLPADGGLLGNLPAWENLLLSSQWYAPAALASLETRLDAWLPQLGYADAPAARRLLAHAPSRLSTEQSLLIGWLRLLLVRPRLVLLSGRALPAGEVGQRLSALLEEELARSALLVVDGETAGSLPVLPLLAREASKS